MTILVQALFSAETAANILARGLEIARLVGLPVTSWRSGDPTRTAYKYLATVLASLEGTYAEYVKSGFLSSAEDDWLTVLAWEVYGVERTEATYAEDTITLTNGGGGFYDVDSGDLTFRASSTGKTFHNTTAGVLSAITARMTGNPSLTFAEVGATGDTITRASGSWVTDGFVNGDWIAITGSASNNVIGQVTTVTATVLTFGTTDLAAEGPIAGVTVTAGATVVFDYEADEAGSDSSVAADEIDELVTTLLGVAIVSSGAAVAVDEQDDPSLREQCTASTGALSPDGPPDAYEYVVRNSELTGVTEITRAATAADAVNGTVTVYVASATGTVSGASITAAQDAVEIWATPLCITPTVVSVTTVAISVSATLTGGDIPTDAEALVETALDAFFAAAPVDGTDVARSKLIKLIHDTLPTVASVSLTVPAADVAMAAGQAPITGTVDVEG